jgi:hypothetical protein
VGHHISYRHPTWPPAELHWQLTNRGLLPLSFDDLWRRRRTFGVGGHDVTAAGDIHELLHVAVHASVHGFYRLGWVVDVARLIRQLPDEDREQAVAESRALGVLRPLALAAGMASALEPHHWRVPLDGGDRRVVQRLVDANWRAMPCASPGRGGRSSRLARRVALRPDFHYKACTVAEAAAPLRRLEGGWR